MKEIINKHNHSWYEEILERNKDNTSKIAMSYWDVDLTYGDFFDLVEKYSKAMRGVGVQKGDEIVACLRQCPDYPVIVAAAKITKSYTGKEVILTEQDLMGKISVNQNDLQYGKDYEIVPNSYVNNIKKGNAKVTIRGIGNYGGTKTITFSIKSRTLLFGK